jgi:hypothetical protein
MSTTTGLWARLLRPAVRSLVLPCALSIGCSTSTEAVAPPTGDVTLACTRSLETFCAHPEAVESGQVGAPGVPGMCVQNWEDARFTESWGSLHVTLERTPCRGWRRASVLRGKDCEFVFMYEEKTGDLKVVVTRCNYGAERCVGGPSEVTVPSAKGAYFGSCP